MIGARVRRTTIMDWRTTPDRMTPAAITTCRNCI